MLQACHDAVPGCSVRPSRRFEWHMLLPARPFCCPQVLLQQVAALLLKEYQDQFRGSPLAATWSYLKVPLVC